MAEKTDIYFDFYTIQITSEGHEKLKDIFASIVQKGISSNITVKGYTRELFKLTEKKAENYWVGQFRKYRKDQLPVLAIQGKDETEIALKDGEAIVEKNCFAYFPDRNILVWQVDRHANHPDRFTDFLKLITKDCKFEALPVSTTESLKRFMKNGIEILNFDISVARPTAPSLYDANKFTKDIFELMTLTGGDRFSLQCGVNLRKKDHGTLSNIKAGVQTLIKSGAATKAQFTISDLGERDFIDLIVDRVSAKRQVESSKKSIPFLTMVDMLQSVYDEKKDVLNEIFGTVQNSLD